MRRLPAITAGLIALAALVATFTAISMRVAEVTNAGEPAPGIIFHIDCNTTLAGIQDQCTYPTGTVQVDVDVVVENNIGAAFDLGAVGFELVSLGNTFFRPLSPPSCDPAGKNCNPDFNDTDINAPDWACSPPPPSADINTDGNPQTAQAFIGCFNAGIPPFVNVAPSSFLRIARTRYAVSSDVTVPLSLREVNIYDRHFVELGTCPTIIVAADCRTASVVIGSGIAPTLTPTPTFTVTPTNTPGPQTTPSGTPTGAVTDIVALNQSVCIVASSIFAGTAPVDAALGCQGASFQPDIQSLMECVHHRPFCPDEPPLNKVFQQIDPVDFAIIDRDRDQFHAGQVMMIAAFVDGDYPVLFETEQGVLLNHTGYQMGQEALCYTPNHVDANPGDPDCDADPTTIGDGVVVVKIYIDESVSRGTFDVRVTQGFVSRTIPINVVGLPTTIVVESLDDKTSIATGAKPRTIAGFTPDVDACDFAVDPPFSGAESSRKTNLLIKVLDDEGEEVVGSLVGWTRTGSRFDSAAFGRTDMPHGGAAIPQIPMLDLGALGVGFVQTMCGGATAGTINAVLVFDPVLDFMAPQDYSLPYSIASTGTPPSPTPTPTACADDADCDGVPDSTDNCGYYPHNGNFSNLIGPIPNPDQANNDRNFIDNSPPYAAVADDRTRADSDVSGDACDTDDDNDGLFDIDETGGPPCLAASGPTDPLKDDSDNDRFLDAAECAISTDPLDPTDKPPLTECGPPGETLFAILSARTAFCYFGIYFNYHFASVDSDADGDLPADGTYDICEIASFNGDRLVNVADTGMLAFGITRGVTLANIDLNRDGVLNPADQGSLAAIISSRACPLRFN